MIQFSLRKLLMAAAIFCAVLATARVYFSQLSPVIPDTLLEQLQPGMSKYEVEALVGRPTNSFDSKRWVYERPAHPGWIGIHFDENGRLERVDNSRALR